MDLTWEQKVIAALEHYYDLLTSDLTSEEVDRIRRLVCTSQELLEAVTEIVQGAISHGTDWLVSDLSFTRLINAMENSLPERTEEEMLDALQSGIIHAKRDAVADWFREDANPSPELVTRMYGELERYFDGQENVEE